MESLKDLPSYNKDNFSNFTQGFSKTAVKINHYLRVNTNDSSKKKPLEIVTDMESLLLRDLQREAKQRQRLKRWSQGSPSLAVKMSKTDDSSQSSDSSMSS
ncbi:uncharacterized protein LOC135338435 [Halichondria panicea]|uniref:uncharacterized protein LOC135338435 n=1 Tax=Halichondria panicea TaxID=6063 RepID=UPI00312B630D